MADFEALAEHEELVLDLVDSIVVGRADPATGERLGPARREPHALSEPRLRPGATRGRHQGDLLRWTGGRGCTGRRIISLPSAVKRPSWSTAPSAGSESGPPWLCPCAFAPEGKSGEATAASAAPQSSLAMIFTILIVIWSWQHDSAQLLS